MTLSATPFPFCCGATVIANWNYATKGKEDAAQLRLMIRQYSNQLLLTILNPEQAKGRTGEFRIKALHECGFSLNRTWIGCHGYPIHFFTCTIRGGKPVPPDEPFPDHMDFQWPPLERDPSLPPPLDNPFFS